MPFALTSLVVLAAWLGAALLVAGVVAPAAFAVLPSRTLAGALVGRVLPVLFWSGMALGLAVAAMGWSLPHGAWRTAAALVVAPRIARLREQIGGAVAALDPADPRRQAFGRLHALSVAWLGVAGLAALVVVFLLIRLLTARSSA